MCPKPPLSLRRREEDAIIEVKEGERVSRGEHG